MNGDVHDGRGFPTDSHRVGFFGFKATAAIGRGFPTDSHRVGSYFRA